METKKKCTKCSKFKPLNEFHNHSKSTDGKRSVCKDCRKIERKEAYKKLKGTLNYYVYTHSVPSTGEIFYVGSGCSTRAWDSHKRSEYWEEIVKQSNGFKVEVVESGLSKRESLDKEQELQINLTPRANLRYAGKGLRWGKLNGKSRSVVNCRGQVFETVTDAAKEFKRTTNNISRACKGQLNYAGKYEDGTPVKWGYYEECP